MGEVRVVGGRWVQEQQESLLRHASSAVTPGGLPPPGPWAQPTPSGSSGASILRPAGYPFQCRKCGKRVSGGKGKKKFKTKAHKKGLCTLHCDGTIRDGGGYPVNPALREAYRLSKKRKLGRENQKPITPGEVFYKSSEWLKLRYRIIARYGRKCMACGTTAERIHVDHIRPRSIYPSLELDEANLQVLCEPCNLGKSNVDETDWRS